VELNFAELASSLAVVGGIGLFFGALVAYVATRFAVEEDPKVEAIADILPGANCGACGFAGCSGYAENAASGAAPVDKCIPGGKAVSDNISAILGVAVVASAGRKIAEVRCIGTCEVAADRFEYHGIPDCKAASMMMVGSKACAFGCLGLGNCAAACPFDALARGANGLPVVDTVKCVGGGVCGKACPRGIIHVVTEKLNVKYVPCNSKAKGKATRDACEVGCIACKACVKACPNGAIAVDDNLAVIDSEKCDNCSKCVEACKRMIIKDAGKVAV
jgi:Na+-translocating ferredoxin:NAD+ oxidoreductase RNF subunit RnfB